jgi:uncharacterized glyoxalase superfamily protein PhnB
MVHEEKKFMRKWRKVFGSKFQGVMLSTLLFLVSCNYAALAYYRDTFSARDYSMIPDPQRRVGYCMMSSMTIADKYLVAETAGHPPDLPLYMAVMSLPQESKDRDEVRIAIGALKDRDKMRLQAQNLSHPVAASCGYWTVNWPSGTTPLDILLKWLQFDSTFSHFVESVRSEPDATERVRIELKKSARAEIKDKG